MTYKRGTETRLPSERGPRVGTFLPEDTYEDLQVLRAEGYTLREIIEAGIKAILAANEKSTD